MFDAPQPYNTMKTPIHQIVARLIASAGLVTLIAACDSREEDARERQADRMEEKADAVRDQSEAKADAIEEQKSPSKSSGTNAGLENAADAQRKAGEATADQLEKKADAVRDPK